jgi:hypothetical protein
MRISKKGKVWHRGGARSNGRPTGKGFGAYPKRSKTLDKPVKYAYRGYIPKHQLNDAMEEFRNRIK